MSRLPGRPAAAAQKRAKTVLRAGFGIFYDRFGLGNTLAAQRFNGLVQQQLVVPNPDFFPNVPVARHAAGFPSRHRRSSRSVRESARRTSCNRPSPSSDSCPPTRTLAVTYTNSHGLHLFRSEDINAPLPGTYNPAVPNSGQFPLGHPGPLELMESSGVYNQNQVIANVNSKLNAGLSLFGFYVYNHARSNTDGIGTFPANPYNFSGEYGPASTDVHHRFTIGGSINLKWAIRISPFIVAQTGAPFDITAGSDLFGTTLFNGRPGIAAGPCKAGPDPDGVRAAGSESQPRESRCSRATTGAVRDSSM